MRAVGGAEAGHGNTRDAPAVDAETVERPGGDEEGQGRVEAARHTYDEALAVSGSESLGKGRYLYVDNFLAAVGKYGRVGGHEGVGRPRA